MNAQAAQALYDAERRGVQQIQFQTQDMNGGLCAYGVIRQADPLLAAFLHDYQDISCPLCGVNRHHEASLIAHLNDYHDLTFSEIARKLGPDSV